LKKIFNESEYLKNSCRFFNFSCRFCLTLQPIYETKSIERNTTRKAEIMSYGRGYIGSKFENGQDLKDVAKKVRADLKAAFGKGWKFGVRISRYSMGQSLSVDVKEAPVQFVTLRDTNDEYGRDWEALDAWKETEDKIAGIVEAYNRDDSDSMTDYFDVDFYKHVSVREAADAQLEALRAAPAVVISAEAIVEAATVEAEPVAEAANVLSIPMTNDAIADARNLLHARVEAAIDAGDVVTARRLLEAVKALY